MGKPFLSLIIENTAIRNTESFKLWSKKEKECCNSYDKMDGPKEILMEEKQGNSERKTY